MGRFNIRMDIVEERVNELEDQVKEFLKIVLGKKRIREKLRGMENRSKIIII